MINILIFEDNPQLRQSMLILLKSESEFKVVGDFPECTQAFDICQQLQPDVVIMDIDMPNMTGIEGLRLVRQAKPNTQIIMHTVFENDESLFDAFCAGASGYILKKHSTLHLIDAVKDVAQGGAPMSPGIARRMLQFFQKPSKKLTYDLTAREQEILQWLVKGYSYKMIASQCTLSVETVKTHLKNIYTKLHVNCGTEAVAKALQENLV